MPFSDGSFTKFPLVEGIPLTPGAPNAVKAGCACDPERNNYGRGYRLTNHGEWWQQIAGRAR